MLCTGSSLDSSICIVLYCSVGDAWYQADCYQGMLEWAVAAGGGQSQLCLFIEH